MKLHKVLFLLSACILGAGVEAISASAQSRWLQTVEIITPVTPEDVTVALLDSLVDSVDRRKVTIRRAPDDTSHYNVTELADRLYSEGLDFSSANQVFVTYRFEANQRRFKSDILSLYFIYRPEEFEDTDVPIAFFDATHPVIRNVLVGKGTRLETNEAVFEPFWDKLQFHQLDQSMVTSIGGRVVRDEDLALSERTRIVGIIRQFLY